MELIYNLDDLKGKLPGAVVSVGNFDGLHLGHAKIVKEVVRRAKKAASRAVIFTFHPHSSAVVAPHRVPPLLMTFAEKLQRFEKMGVDVVICPREPRAILALSPDEFVQNILVDGIGAGCVVEGRGFRFGKGRKGTPRKLQALGHRLGFDVRTVEPVKVGGRIVSSTRIRQLIRQGHVAEAARFLGRPFVFVGTVTRWQRRGTALGFPTVNMKSPQFLVPREGVYAGRVLVGGKWYSAAISVGGAPTFGKGDADMVEAFILGFRGSLYGKTVSVEFRRRLRDLKTFPNAEALQGQIKKDCTLVRKALSSRR